MVTAAFFDLDKTIIKGNSGMRVAAHYFFSGRIGPISAAKVVYRFFFYFIGKSDPIRFFMDTYDFLKGKKFDEEKKACDAFFEKKLKTRIFKESVKLIDWHKNQGHKVVIVTNSLDMMISKVMDYVNVNHLIATSLEVRDGIITGKSKTVNFGKNKVKYIRELAGKWDIDLKKSYAYSDNNTDIYMLGAVGNPIAVNPMRKMKKFAQNKKWKIINYDRTLGQG